MLSYDSEDLRGQLLAPNDINLPKCWLHFKNLRLQMSLKSKEKEIRM